MAVEDLMKALEDAHLLEAAKMFRDDVDKINMLLAVAIGKALPWSERLPVHGRLSLMVDNPESLEECLAAR